MGNNIKVGTKFGFSGSVWTVTEISIYILFGYKTKITATDNNGREYGWKLEDFAEFVKDNTIKVLGA